MKFGSLIDKEVTRSSIIPKCTGHEYKVKIFQLLSTSCILERVAGKICFQKQRHYGSRILVLCQHYARCSRYSIMKVKNDHRNKLFNLSNWKEEAWKNQGFFTLIYHRSSHMNYIIYTLSLIVLCSKLCWHNPTDPSHDQTLRKNVK